MSKRVQLIRGTSAFVNALVFYAGELGVDTTVVELRIGDGSTAGGIAIARKDLTNITNAVFKSKGNSADLVYKDLSNLSITDTFKYTAGAGIIINEAGAAVDFRVETDSEENAFVVDGSADVVIISVPLQVDVINENTVATGVTVDGVLLKDSTVTTDTINEKTPAAGVTIDGATLKDNGLLVDTIVEKTADNGVTIEGLLLKDSTIATDTISEKTADNGVTVDGLNIKDGVAANHARTNAANTFDADFAQKFDGTKDYESLDAMAGDEFTIEIGFDAEIDADVDGTIIAPTSGYGVSVLDIYNNGTRSLALSGFPAAAINNGALSGEDTKIDILIVRRKSVNGSDIVDYWIYNRP